MGIIFNKILIKNYSKYYGWRKPRTQVGTWDGAFVYSIIFNRPHMYVYFIDGMDLVSTETLTWDILNTEIAKNMRNGWSPMTADDIYQTAGVTT